MCKRHCHFFFSSTHMLLSPAHSAFLDEINTVFANARHRLPHAVVQHGGAPSLTDMLFCYLDRLAIAAEDFASRLGAMGRVLHAERVNFFYRVPYAAVCVFRDNSMGMDFVIRIVGRGKPQYRVFDHVDMIRSMSKKPVTLQGLLDIIASHARVQE